MIKNPVYIFRDVFGRFIISTQLQRGAPIGVYNDPYALLLGLWEVAEPNSIVVTDAGVKCEADCFGFSAALQAFGYPVSTFTMRALWLMSKADGFPNFANPDRRALIAGRGRKKSL